MALALTGDKLPAETAAEWGLIWNAWQTRNCRRRPPWPGSSPPVRRAPTPASRESIQAAATNTLEAQLGVERDFMAELGRSKDYREASPPSWPKARTELHRGDRHAATLTPQQVAERCAEIMWPDDKPRGASAFRSRRAGRTVTRMTVRDDAVNSHDICHGGFIFALADSAFAYACNTFNVRTVASGVDINFIAPAHKGNVLTAAGHGRHQGGRAGVPTSR